MLKAEFIAAKASITPLEIGGVSVHGLDINATGNAFAGSSANRDNEMVEVLRNAMMGNQDSSSINGATMRLSTTFAHMAKDKDKRSDQDRIFYLQVMLNRMSDMKDGLVQAMDASKLRIEEIDIELMATDQIQQLIIDGEFDLQNKEHQKLFQQAFPNSTALSQQDFSNQTMGNQLDIVENHALALKAEHEELSEFITDGEALLPELNQALEYIQNGKNIAFDSENGQFTNRLLERARQNSCVDIDPAQPLTEEELNTLISHIESDMDVTYTAACDIEINNFEFEKNSALSIAGAF